MYRTIQNLTDANIKSGGFLAFDVLAVQSSLPPLRISFAKNRISFLTFLSPPYYRRWCDQYGYFFSVAKNDRQREEQGEEELLTEREPYGMLSILREQIGDETRRCSTIEDY